MKKLQSELSSSYGANISICSSRRAALLIALSAVAVLYALMRFRLVHTWATNDDVGLSLICSGTGFASSPDPHLMFTNIVIGYVLAHLYEIARHVPWYGCYMVLINLIAICALAYSLLYRRLLVTGLFAVGILFSLVGLPNLCAMQFTTDSCILGLAGFGLILSWWESRADGQADLATLLTGTCVLVLSSLVRYQSFLMILLLGFIFFAIRLLRQMKLIFKGKQSADLKLLALGLFSSFVIATACYQMNVWAYGQNPGWSEFYKANALTANFADFSFGLDCPPERKVQAEREAGWSDNDLTMIQSFFFFDSNLFSVKQMEIASNLLRGSRQFSPEKIFAELRVDVESLPMRPFVYCFLFFMLFYSSQLFDRRKIFLLCVAITILAIIMLTGFKLAPHVYKAIAAFLVFVQLFYFNRAQRLPENICSWHSLLSLTCSLCFVTVIASQAFTDCRRLCRKAVAQNQELKRSLVLLNPTDDQVFIIWREFFPFEYVLPFDDLYENFQHFNMFPFTLRANSALAAPILRKHNINLNNFASRLTDNNVYLFSSPTLNPFLEIYLAEHYQVKRHIVPVKAVQSSAFKLFVVR